MNGYDVKRWKVSEDFMEWDEMVIKMAGSIHSLMVSSDNTKCTVGE